MSKAEDHSIEMRVIFLCLYRAMNPQAKFWSDEMPLFARTESSIKSQLECRIFTVSEATVKPFCNLSVITVWAKEGNISEGVYI